MKPTQKEVEEWCEEHGFSIIKLNNGTEAPLTKREIKAEGINGVLKRVADVSDIDIDDIQIKTRKREILEARQMCHYIIKKHFSISLSQIAWHVGKKDHATILNSAKRIQNLLDTDKLFREKYKDIIYLYSLS